MAQGLTGIYHVLPTPFTQSGDVDFVSLRRLIDHVVARGVRGVLALGVAGEVTRLTTAERQLVLSEVVATVAGRVHIVVGVSAPGTRTVIERIRECEEFLPTAVMVAPAPHSRFGPAMVTHFEDIAQSTSLPIVLQDFPVENGTYLSAQELATLCDAVPSILTLKLEDYPTPVKTRTFLDAVQRRDVTVLGGLGGVFSFFELRAGSAGFMTGFAYPELLVELHAKWESGSTEAAFEIYREALPIMLYEGQPGVGPTIRKSIMVLRGWMDTPHVRAPGRTSSSAETADIEFLSAHLRADVTR